MQTLLPFILASSILNFTIISHHFSPNRSSCCSWRQYSFYTITASLYQASSLGAVSPLHACFVMILQALHYLALFTFHPDPSHPPKQYLELASFLILLFTFTSKREAAHDLPRIRSTLESMQSCSYSLPQKGQAILSILLTHLNLKISFTPITITKHQQQYYPYTIISSTTAR
jgi:hypothetical protein